MKNIKIKGFTIVELIVVIIILIILGTISFTSIVNYSKNSRDSLRKTDIKNIETSLELFYIDRSYYPNPTNYTEIVYSGALAWKQGIFGDNTKINLGNISKTPLDPLTDTPYAYSIANNRSEYELGAIMEGENLAYSIFPNTYALELFKTYIKGNYNQNIIKVTTGSLDYILAVPTIIASDILDADLVNILNNSSLSLHSYYNSPFSYINTSIYSSGITNFIPNNLIIFSGTVSDLKTSTSSQINFLYNLQQAYSGTILQTNSAYLDLINTEINLNSPSNEASLLAIYTINNTLKLDTPIDFLIYTITELSDFILDKLNNFGGTSQDFFKGIDSDGINYFGIGYSQSNLSSFTGGKASSGSNDFVITKFDNDLNLIKIKNFGGTNSDIFNNLIYDGTDYIAIGVSPSNLSSFTGGKASSGSNDFVIAKFDNDLNLIKIKNFGTITTEIFNSLVYDGTNYITIGYTDGNMSSFTGGSLNSGNYDFVIAKFDTDLNLIKINNLGGTDEDVFNNLIYDGTYYIVVGNSASNLSSFTGGNVNLGNKDFVIAKFDNNLNLIKINNLGGTMQDSLAGIIKDGDYISVGLSSSDLSSFTGGSTNLGGSYLVISKFDANLNLIEINNIGGNSGNGEALNSVIKNGINYIAIGSSQSNLSSFTGGNLNSGFNDFFITKF